MMCPSCKVELKIADREAIEVDYCPQCRGVWLDRGELDKIIERSSRGEPARRIEPARRDPDSAPPRGWRGDHDDDDDDRDPRTGRRRRGWLGDLFDFD